MVRIVSARFDARLYEVQQKARSALEMAVEQVIRTEDEPRYRQFFSHVAQLCGRPMAP